ncbi:hypothetical protein ABW21_db0208230 [Orbilia brochopaga]|nr:hypothetical protein ABW21_db0208230 [Drechslerella brochopaga]
MQFGYKSVLALTAMLELKHQDAVVFVKQEILEIVGYTSTVWVQPPPPSETPEPEPPVVEPPAAVETPVAEEPAPVVETPPVETPVVEAPPVETPEVHTPVVEAPVVETPTPPPATVVVQPTQVPPAPLAPVASPAPQPQLVPEYPSQGGGGSGSHSGKATYYDAGLGSCGETHSNSDMICALSKATMGKTAGANPNLNPMCGTMIRVKSAANPTGITVKIVDTCPGCAGVDDLDLTPAAFDQLGDQAAGVIDITWDYI